jgi:hypothetical protein
MTFLEMKQALYDLLGITSETTMIARLINESKDEFVSAKKWWWRETTATQSFITTGKTYVTAAEVGEILEIDDGDGIPLEKVHKQTYIDLYRGDTSTAAKPSVYTIDGTSTPGALTFSVWPVPAAISTGTRRYLRNIPDLTLDTESLQHVPTTHHFAIIKGAEARYREWENDQSAPVLRQEFQQSIDKLFATDGAAE